MLRPIAESVSENFILRGHWGSNCMEGLLGEAPSVKSARLWWVKVPDTIAGEALNVQSERPWRAKMLRAIAEGISEQFVLRGPGVSKCLEGWLGEAPNVLSARSWRVKVPGGVAAESSEFSVRAALAG